MPYCHACGTEVDESANYCPECGADQSSPTRSPPRSVTSTTSSLEGQFWTTALIGGLVGFFLALFFGAMLTPLYVLGILGGGALGGYLYGGDESAGLRIGALTGALASVPVVFFIILGAVLGFGGFVFGAFDPTTPMQGMIGASAVAFVFIFVLTFALIANLLFGALGGYVGAAVAQEPTSPPTKPASAPPETDAKHDR